MPLTEPPESFDAAAQPAPAPRPGPPPRLVLFDIDGTLVRTGGAGVHAFGRTAELLYGVPGVAERTRFHGRTDTALVKEFFLGNGLQGRALVAPDGRPLPTGREAVLIEENQQRAYLGFERPVRAHTLVTARHRMSVYAEGTWGELYDLASHPGETVNLWDEPSTRELKLELLLQMARAQIEHGDTSPNPTRVA